jgi:hypothetical protein
MGRIVKGIKMLPRIAVGLVLLLGLLQLGTAIEVLSQTMERPPLTMEGPGGKIELPGDKIEVDLAQMPGPQTQSCQCQPCQKCAHSIGFSGRQTDRIY